MSLTCKLCFQLLHLQQISIAIIFFGPYKDIIQLEEDQNQDLTERVDGFDAKLKVYNGFL